MQRRGCLCSPRGHGLDRPPVTTGNGHLVGVLTSTLPHALGAKTAPWECPTPGAQNRHTFENGAEASSSIFWKVLGQRSPGVWIRTWATLP